MLADEREIIQNKVKQIQADLEATEKRIPLLEKDVARLQYPKTETESILAQSLIEALNSERANVRIYKKDSLDKKHELIYSSKETTIEPPPSEPLKPVKCCHRGYSWFVYWDFLCLCG